MFANFVMQDGSVRPFMILSLSTPESPMQLAPGQTVFELADVGLIATGVLFFDGPEDHLVFPDDSINHESQGVKSNCVAWVPIAKFEKPVESAGIFPVVIATPGTWHWAPRRDYELSDVITAEDIDAKLKNFLENVVTQRLNRVIEVVNGLLDSHSAAIGTMKKAELAVREGNRDDGEQNKNGPALRAIPSEAFEEVRRAQAITGKNLSEIYPDKATGDAESPAELKGEIAAERATFEDVEPTTNAVALQEPEKAPEK